MEHILLYAIVPIFAVMLLGFVAGKRGAFSGEDAKMLNKVVLDYALPAALFVAIVSASREMLLDDLKLAVISTVGIMAMFMAVYYVFRVFKSNTGADAAVSALISGSPSIGFLGFAVLEPIFGTSPEVALVVAIVSIVVNAIGIPVGLSLMNASLERTNPSNKKHNFWAPVLHALVQPVALAPILAVIWVMVGIPWPEWASPTFNLIKGANASLAVFSAGITLSAIKVKINTQVVMGTVMKMIVMPTFMLALGLLCGLDALNLKMLVVSVALPPAFSGIIIADENNIYVSNGTSSLTLSMIVFIVALPAWIWLTDMAISVF